LFVKKLKNKLHSVSLFFRIVSVVDNEVTLINGSVVKRENIYIYNKCWIEVLEIFWLLVVLSNILFKFKDKEIFSSLGNLYDVSNLYL